MSTPSTTPDPEGAKVYLLQHNMHTLFESMARGLVTQRPDRQFEYLVERIVAAAKEGGTPLPCHQPQVKKAEATSEECLAALRHTAGLFGALEADLKAAPKEKLSTFPALHEFSRDIERLQAAVDRVVPKSFSGGTGSRFEFA